MDFAIEKPGERKTISNRKRTRFLVSIIRYVILIRVGVYLHFSVSLGCSYQSEEARRSSDCTHPMAAKGSSMEQLHQDLHRYTFYPLFR